MMRRQTWVPRRLVVVAIDGAGTSGIGGGAGQDDGGARRGHDVGRRPRPRVQGHPVCRTAGRRGALEGAGTGRPMDRGEEDRGIRPALRRRAASSATWFSATR